MKCYWCEEPIDPERDMNDGWIGLHKDCARIVSNNLYNRILSAYESEEEIVRMAFCKYGFDDFAYEIDKESEKL